MRRRRAKLHAYDLDIYAHHIARERLTEPAQDRLARQVRRPATQRSIGVWGTCALSRRASRYARLIAWPQDSWTGPGRGAARSSPVHLDSVLVGPRQAVDVAFAANNPGVWMFHCHVLLHTDMGMTTSINYVRYSTPFEMGTRSGNMPE